MTEPTTRRKFLKTGCLTVAAVGVTLAGGGTLAATVHAPIDMPETTFGESSMNNRILVAYATKAGATAEVATRIGQTLSAKNIPVDVMPIKKVTDLSAYSAVVLGSAIRMGSLLPAVTKFVQENQATLQQKSFSVFITCMTLVTDTEEKRKEASAYLDPLRAVVKPAHEGLFAGVLDPKKLALLERWIMNALKTPAGDFRNWDQINAFAESLAA